MTNILDLISTYLSVIDYILTLIGLWKLFEKSNVKRKWIAFIPVANQFKLAKCADREDEASAYAFAMFFYYSFYTLSVFLTHFGRDRTLSGYMITILLMVLSIIIYVYKIRIYAGLCEVYKRKKIWILPWIISQGISSVIWGFSKKFTPSFVLDEDPDVSENSTSNADTSALEKGLSVKIKKRTTRKGLTTKTMLKDINLDIEPGKMVLLLGGSGAGKTTFFNAVTGYEKADATVTLNGFDVYKHFDKMKYEIGFVPQQDLIRVNDTVYKTLMDSAMLRLPTSVSRKERHDRVEEVMNLFGLSAIRNNIVQKQSGGQKKRISIATEYISNPSLFILDEPDSGLDGILARELMQRLHDISREGKIVIVITHTPDRVIDLFDQIIVLAKDNKRTGRLVFFGDIKDAKEFFGTDKMEEIVKMINRPDEGGDGRTDELVEKFAEARK